MAAQVSICKSYKPSLSSLYCVLCVYMHVFVHMQVCVCVCVCVCVLNWSDWVCHTVFVHSVLQEEYM